jgi:hypothetical protein
VHGERDARALIDKLRRAFVHPDGKAVLGHGQRGSEAADTAADDSNLHVIRSS